MQLHSRSKVVQVILRTFSSRMASSNIKTKTFGIISDIQYADAEDATDFR